jgi:hypothetical protein
MQAPPSKAQSATHSNGEDFTNSGLRHPPFSKDNVLCQTIPLPHTPPISEGSPTQPASPEEATTVEHFRGLISQLTIEEKVSLLSGTSFTKTAGVPRLSIPQLKVTNLRSDFYSTTSNIVRSVTRSPKFVAQTRIWKIKAQHAFPARLVSLRRGMQNLCLSSEEK